MGFLFHPAYAYIALLVVPLGTLAELHTLLRTGVDKRKGVGDGVYIDDDTHVAHVTARTGTGEEHEVAGLHLATLDGLVDGILFTRRSTYPHVVLTFVDVACEA